MTTNTLKAKLRVGGHAAGTMHLELQSSGLGRILHAAGAEFCVDCGGGRARPRGAIGEAGADHLAEHLVTFGRGGEVAARAERIAGGVIMRVAQRHTGLDRERPASTDALLEVVGEAQATLSVPAIGSIRSRRPLAVTIR